jgi:GH24 family phage-related lysozyme (muramidase)
MKELIALYWPKSVNNFQDIIKNLPDGKLPNDLESFNKLIQEHSTKDSLEGYKEKINQALENPNLSPAQKDFLQSAAQWISSAEARNVKAQELWSNFESLPLEKKTVTLIEHFEWFSAKSFWDYKQYTRWYGTKAPWPNQIIEPKAAEKELIDKLNKVYNLKNRLSKLYNDKSKGEKVYNALNDNQKAAMTSFIFNLWPWKLSWFKNLLEQYAQAEWEQRQEIANQIWEKMLHYNRAWWKILKWLVARRKTEAKLFKKLDTKSEKNQSTLNEEWTQKA